MIDDDSTVHLIGERLLHSLGVAKNIYKAWNGKEALDILIHYCEGLITIPELIFLDLHMPVMNGFDFMKAFNRMTCIDRGLVTVAVFTSSVDAKEIAQIKSLGVNYCLEKPMSVEGIRRVLG